MRIVAVEEHYIRRPEDVAAPAVMQAMLAEVGEHRIADMDAAGIDVQVLSLGAPGAQAFTGADALEKTREENDWLAEAVGRHPDRLKAFAALPTARPDDAADELERTVRELGFLGALINGHTEGRYLDDERFWPILERAEALGVPLYLHPGEPPAAVAHAYYAGFGPEVGAVLGTVAWGWHIDTGLHVLRMILAGVFDRFPNLQVVIGHLGEGLPFMLPRANRVLPTSLTGLSRTVTEYVLTNVHFTIGGFFFLPPLLNALCEVGAERILFSVDYPIGSNLDGRTFLDGLPVSPTDREKIAHGNAERLMEV